MVKIRSKRQFQLVHRYLINCTANIYVAVRSNECEIFAARNKKSQNHATEFLSVFSHMRDGAKRNENHLADNRPAQQSTAQRLA